MIKKQCMNCGRYDGFSDGLLNEKLEQICEHCADFSGTQAERDVKHVMRRAVVDHDPLAELLSGPLHIGDIEAWCGQHGKALPCMVCWNEKQP